MPYTLSGRLLARPPAFESFSYAIFSLESFSAARVRSQQIYLFLFLQAHLATAHSVPTFPFSWSPSLLTPSFDIALWISAWCSVRLSFTFAQSLPAPYSLYC